MIEKKTKLLNTLRQVSKFPKINGEQFNKVGKLIQEVSAIQDDSLITLSLEKKVENATQFKFE